MRASTRAVVFTGCAALITLGAGIRLATVREGSAAQERTESPATTVPSNGTVTTGRAAQRRVSPSHAGLVAHAPPRAPDSLGTDRAADATEADLTSESGLEVRFSDDGAAEIRADGQRFTLGAGGLRRAGAAATRFSGGRPTQRGGRFEAERAPGVVEWWQEAGRGVEHGFTLARRPEGDGAIEIELRVVGDPHLVARDGGVDVVAPSGLRLARYEGLTVVDARGRALSASLAVATDRVLLRFDDAGARYPVVVDPVLYAFRQRLVETPPSASVNFGRAMDTTADGSRLVVGEYSGGFGQPGYVFVFVRQSGTYVLEQRLEPTAGVAVDAFGVSVCVDATGTRVLVGANSRDDGGNVDAGAAYAFTRVGSTWTQEAMLLASDRADGDSFGVAVDCNSDATRVVVGAHAKDKTGSGAAVDAGATYVFSRAGATWTQEAKLLTPDYAASDFGGRAVAIAADASRLVIGAPFVGTTDDGAAYVYLRSGTTWSFEQKLTPPTTAQEFGAALDIDTTGARIVAGSMKENRSVETGAVYVYARSGTTWTGEANFIGSNATTAFDNFGSGVHFDDSASTLVVGAQADEANGANSASGLVYVLQRSGTAWSEVQLLAPTALPTNAGFGRAVTLSGDGAWLAGSEGLVTGSDGAVHVYDLGGTGSGCGGPSDCANGFCVDGVCCDSACGGGANDCMACSAALTGGTDGVCAALSASVAPTVTCRTSAGTCDVAEVCSAGITICPADVVSPGTTVCRVAMGDCDLAESCTGTSGVCPADTLATSGSTCRAAVGTCDVAESCTGTTPTCPADVKVPAATVCRTAAGSCDDPEVCDGSSGACPGDRLLPANTVCRGALGACDVAETCSGGSPLCPSDVAASAGTVCRASIGICDVTETCDGSSTLCPGDATAIAGTICRIAAGPCDVAESCTGAAASCPADTFVAAGTVCNTASGACDVADTCSGASAACVDQRAPNGAICDDGQGCTLGDSCTAGACTGSLASPGTVCRGSVGICDAAESCNGVSTACPADGAAPGGTVCRASSGSCDPAEVCDGTATSCPGDVVLPVGTVCRAAVGLCDLAESCTGAAQCPVDDAAPAGTVCRASAGVCDLIEACDGSSTSCPADTFAAAGTVCGGGSSGGCDAVDVCTGSSAACSNRAAMDGDVCDDGLGCTILDACTGGTCSGTIAPAGTTCRPSEGGCDVAELCDGSSGACPADDVLDSGTVCRASGGSCDVAEVCDGSAATCPGDTRLPAGTVCRAALDVCDVAESCDGSAECPTDEAAVAGTTCRPAASMCDAAETCDGASPGCPTDVVEIAGVVCRASSGQCDPFDTCDGTRGDCPDVTIPDGAACDDDYGCTTGETCVAGSCVGAPVAAGVVCRVSAGTCDVEERCDGVAPACPGDVVVPADTVCRTSAGGCDLAEVCDGRLGVCPGDVRLAAGTPCRTARGACDVEEACDGTAACPADVLAAAGTSCRPAVGACDAAESCDGVGFTCPADEPRADGSPCDDGLTCTLSSACVQGACAPQTQIDCSDGNPCTTDVCAEPSGCRNVTVPACLADAGLDGAVVDPDASTEDAAVADAAHAVPVQAGCSCRVGSHGAPATTWLCATAAAGMLLGRRRARRARAGVRDAAG